MSNQRTVRQPAPRSIRVFIYEDREEDVLMSIRTLRSAGFAVTADSASSLQALQEQLLKSTYDIILSDYRLPGSTGMDAFETVKSLGLHIPFVLVTGSLGDEMAVECVKQGVSDYVLKDHLARLPSAVHRALDDQRLRRERDQAQDALRRSEEQLRQQNHALEEQNRRVEAASRMKSEFVANMSHELRSPLNSVIGFSELMHDGRLGPLNESQKECFGRILSCARHLLRLINDVLDMARVEAGKLDFRPESVSVPQLVDETCDSLSALVAEKRIQIIRQVDLPAEVRIDPARFKQVLYNYLSNALKFSEGCDVRVTVKPEGGDAFRLEVADSGLGIADSDLERLFTETGFG